MLRKSKVILTFTLALLICATSIISVLATNLNNNEAIIGSEDKPVQAAITKNLRLPVGTTVPKVNFNFVITPKTVDGVEFNPTEPNMPRLGALSETPGTGTFTLSFSDTDEDPRTPIDDLVNVDSIMKETGNIFANVDFPHAGEFVYEITEEANTNSAIDAESNKNEWLSYSKAKYTITLYVADTKDGKSTYIYGLGARLTTKDDGEAVGDSESGKVDPTPGGYEDKYLFSQMIFANDYVKTNGPVDPENPDPMAESTLFVSKTVTGDFSNKFQLFDFKISLTLPSLIPNPPNYYRAYLVDSNGRVDDSYIAVSTTGETEFRLRDGQRLVFVDTPVGTGYMVEEIGSANYSPSLTVTTGGEKMDYAEREMGENFPSGPQFVGEPGNSAAFTNRRDTITPTGLNLNDLPFIGLIILGLGTLITFFVVKVCKRARNY